MSKKSTAFLKAEIMDAEEQVQISTLVSKYDAYGNGKYEGMSGG